MANYDIPCLYVTIEQNGVVLDSFSQPLYNGVPATYNFAGYGYPEETAAACEDGRCAEHQETDACPESLPLPLWQNPGRARLVCM